MGANQISSFLLSSALDVERLSRRSLAKADWALDVSFRVTSEHEHEHEQEQIPHHFR